MFWAEEGPGLETISLVDFAQRVSAYRCCRRRSARSLKQVLHTVPGRRTQRRHDGRQVRRPLRTRFDDDCTFSSPRFSSPCAVLMKWPTQTPTVTFPRNKVLRTPDLNSDSLKMSVPAMPIICGRFVEKYSDPAELDIAELLPDHYLPSCIRGTVQLYAASPPVKMVWQLDYNSDETLAEPEIQLRPCGPTGKMVARPILKFQLTRKDATTLEVRVPDKLKAVWVDGAPVREEEVS